MNQLQREKQQLESQGLVINTRDVTQIMVKIPQCCRDGGIIIDSTGRTIGPCPHVLQIKKMKKGNVGL